MSNAVLIFIKLPKYGEMLSDTKSGWVEKDIITCLDKTNIWLGSTAFTFPVIRYLAECYHTT